MIMIRSCNSCNCMFIIVGLVLLCFYAFPNPPKLSIKELSVPAFNKSSDQAVGNLYFDLQVSNMNKAIGLYYDDPFSLAFFYYPYEEPYQKYVWVGTVPAFYQGNGKTKHIRSVMGNNLRLPSTVVVDPVETGQDLPAHNHVRTLLKDHIQLPSTFTNDDASQVLAETNQDMVGRILAVNVRIAVVINYRFKYWAGSSKNQAELGANVLVNLNTGERISAGSIDLVESAAPTGGPVILMVLFFPFLLIMCF